MTCRIQKAGDAAWRFCPDTTPPVAARVQCVARARIVDDLALGTPLTPIAVTSGRPEFAGRSGPDGLVGAVGQPFPDLSAAQVAGTGITLALTSPGYAPLALTGTLGAQPLYPDSFVPLDFGTWRLERVAVQLGGQVTRVVGGASVPVAGATVAITAATPAPGLPGAQPAPPAAASFLALTTLTDAAGKFRLGPLSRAVRVTLTASEGSGSLSSDIDVDYAQPLNLIDFVLP
jgi:hypothetical protein